MKYIDTSAFVKHFGDPEVEKGSEKVRGLISQAKMGIQPDHVHLLLSAKPRYSPAKMINLIKGGTSGKIREEFPELEEVYWGDSFWADGYFVRTMGRMTQGTIQDYIRAHRAP